MIDMGIPPVQVILLPAEHKNGRKKALAAIQIPKYSRETERTDDKTSLQAWHTKAHCARIACITFVSAGKIVHPFNSYPYEWSYYILASPDCQAPSPGAG
jgi:hypothetical protein